MLVVEADGGCFTIVVVSIAVSPDSGPDPQQKLSSCQT